MFTNQIMLLKLGPLPRVYVIVMTACSCQDFFKTFQFFFHMYVFKLNM